MDLTSVLMKKIVRITQYADDAILFLNSKEELCSALNVINEFGRIAGTKLSIGKCEGLWLGKDKHLQENCKLFGMIWPTAMRCLGIFVGHDKERNEKLNWLDKIDKIRQLILSWSKRDLSIYGKVQIIKSFAVSQLVNVASLLPIPNEIVKMINKIFFKYLWKSKDKVKRIKLLKPSKDGGINMIDIESMFRALKAAWIPRLNAADPTKQSWAQLAHFFITKFVRIEDIRGFSIDKDTEFPELKNMHPFYKEVVMGYCYSNVIDYEQFCSNIYSQSLWGNLFINVSVRKRKNVLYLRNWIRSGVNKVGDLQFINGKVNEAYLYEVIQWKTNIHSEILMVKKALEPYSHLILNYEHITNDIDPAIVRKKSREFYAKLVNIKCNTIESTDMCPNLHHMCTLSDISVECAFRNQLCSGVEIKLKEFNFKVMHGILPCNSNLKKWKLKESDVCDICNSQQTIEHLLFECHRATRLWHLVEDAYQITVYFRNIVCGLRDYDLIFNHVITLLAFLLYKEWLLMSLKNKVRCVEFPYHFYISELKLREKIYITNGMDLNLNPIILVLKAMSKV